LKKFGHIIIYLTLLALLVGCSSGSANENAYTGNIKPEVSEVATDKKSNGLGIDFLKSVSFVTSKTGFMSLRNSSEENCLLKTTDGGNSWETVNREKDLYALCFVSEKIGYAIENIGDNNEPKPVLVKTVNGGVD